GISPFSPGWRKRLLPPVLEIAGTGLDGVYVDLPYWMTRFKDWENPWASLDKYTVAAFHRVAGLDPRHDMRLGDVFDPHFRRWIDFRIRAITDFMKEIDSNVKAANPHCITIAEIYPGIEETVPRVGADVYQLYPVVDAIAHEYQGMGDFMAAPKSHEHVFYDLRRPLDPIGVYFSPQSRNYFPREFTDSFKGTMKLLLTAHR